MNFAKNAQEIGLDLASLRHRLHQVPEIGYDLPQTQALILKSLKELPLEISVGKDLSSITAVLRGATSSSATLLRADMDALLIRTNQVINKYLNDILGQGRIFPYPKDCSFILRFGELP
jgi:metal-dependent amidase/aminoacylase/carboxypeptidase family protein